MEPSVRVPAQGDLFAPRPEAAVGVAEPFRMSVTKVSSQGATVQVRVELSIVYRALRQWGMLGDGDLIYRHVIIHARGAPITPEERRKSRALARVAVNKIRRELGRRK